MTQDDFATLQERFSLAEQIACIDREVRMREMVYPKLIGKGRMSEQAAAHELACMRQVARTLRALVDDRK